MPPKIDQKKIRAYFRYRETYPVVTAAKMAGIARSTAHVYERNGPRNGDEYRNDREKLHDPDVIELDEVCPEARKALEDFAYFRRRYFGRISTPWQEEAAYQALEWLGSPDKEYVVVNCPPGSGKSTLFTHDIPAWMIVRNRAIRCLFGSRTEKQARWYTNRLRRTFARRVNVRAEPEMAALGLALDAESTLIKDFGRFQPDAGAGDVWRAEEFTIAQHGDIPLEDKEPTASAYGMDSGFLGGRFDLVVWDDLVDKTTLRTLEAIENQQKWWEEEAETRLEPGGLLILQGQRMGANDLYRYALDQTIGDEDEDNAPRKYRHVVFKAHYEDRCAEDHAKTAKAWPEGCLLDPRRLPWKGSGGLATIQRNRTERFRVLYQQEDVDPDSVLVQKIWIDGGDNKHGSYPGCWDKDRELCQLPRNLAGQMLSVATADPSPTKFWAIQWWAVRVDEDGPQERYLLDLIRQGMDAPDFLDWDHDNRAFVGVMQEWQERSKLLGIPITHWIVEKNAAQRFLLQYDHVRRWQRKWGVDILGHETHRNKSDPDFGVQTIASHYRYGRVRLPGKNNPSLARTASMKLVDEVTRWPDPGTTDDQTMAHWFLEWQLPNLYIPRDRVARSWRPSFMRRAS